MTFLSRLVCLSKKHLTARQQVLTGYRASVVIKSAFRGQLVRAMASSGGGSEGTPKHTNRLAKEKSPYLLQHKHNPVDWYPWGDEAFEKAKKEGKPIFLSVGYSTCHWCHVMERESFENEKIGQILNEKYVPVKVDREERPDVDRVYMSYVQATTGGGGWPMSVWLTPELKPFIGATYFPPEDKAGRPGFATILNLISNQWESNKEKFTMQASIIMNAISEHVSEIKGTEIKLPAPECIDKLFSDMASSFDDEMGGFGGAPKFPQPVNLNFLLRYHVYKQQEEEGKKSLAMCLKTLECMEKGGMHDHVGQGFHRYSTDRFWHVPHFEKMLYDQSQMTVVYLDGYQLKKDEKFVETARDILLYVMRDLSHKLGGFYSAEDADSLPTSADTQKKEGAFCVWEEEELRTLLTDSITNTAKETVTLADLFIKHYGVESTGNVKPHQDPHKELVKKNVLIVRGSLEETAAHFKLSTAETKESLAKAREILLEERSKRPPPHLDDKMVTAWNGLMISGFSRAAQTLNEEVYLKRAVKAAEFVRTYLYDEKTGKLYRSCYRGEGDNVSQFEKPIYGFVSDYVYLIRGLMDLYEASLDEQWLSWAVQLQDKLDQLFWDTEGGGYYEVTSEDPSILLRLKEEQDGAEPSANSCSTGNLLRLSSFVNKKEYQEKAERILSVYESRLTKIPIALPELMGAFIVQRIGVKQIIIAGDRDAEDTKALLRCVHSHFIPNKTLMLCDGNKDGFLFSKLAVFKTLERKDGKATAYVCQNYSCAQPVNSVEELKQVLAGN